MPTVMVQRRLIEFTGPDTATIFDLVDGRRRGATVPGASWRPYAWLTSAELVIIDMSQVPGSAPRRAGAAMSVADRWHVLATPLATGELVHRQSGQRRVLLGDWLARLGD